MPASASNLICSDSTAFNAKQRLSCSTVLTIGRESERTGKYVFLDYEVPQDTVVFHYATYQEIREWVLREYGLKVFSSQVTHVKRKHGIVMRGDMSRPLPEGVKPPDISPEKETAIEAALRHFKMI